MTKHKCPRCGCRDTVADFGCYRCSCCGLTFTSQELDEANEKKGGRGQ